MCRPARLAPSRPDAARPPVPARMPLAVAAAQPHGRGFARERPGVRFRTGVWQCPAYAAKSPSWSQLAVAWPGAWDWIRTRIAARRLSLAAVRPLDRGRYQACCRVPAGNCRPVHRAGSRMMSAARQVGAGAMRQAENQSERADHRQEARADIPPVSADEQAADLTAGLVRRPAAGHAFPAPAHCRAQRRLRTSGRHHRAKAGDLRPAPAAAGAPATGMPAVCAPEAPDQEDPARRVPEPGDRVLRRVVSSRSESG
jgi:hypothetical protein